MNCIVCIVCKERGDVVVHVENDDPLIYCDECRVEDKPETRFRIVSELRITRPKTADKEKVVTVFDVACGLTTAACLSIRDEDLVGVDQSVLDAVSMVLEENRRLKDAQRVGPHQKTVRTEPGDDEAKKAAKLSAMVEAELIVMVERVSREVGVDRKWVLSDIVYIATQRVRQIKDQAP